MSSVENSSPILIITGMHRSGTSLTASLLQSAGLDIGENLLNANDGNIKGYFENVSFLKFHESILRSLGLHSAGWCLEEKLDIPSFFVHEAIQLVQANASTTQPWGWKEPRTTLFLDFWQQLLPTAHFLFVYRSPWEVVDSLFRRVSKQNADDSTFYYNPEFALKVWQHYNRRLLTFYTQYPDRCFLVSVESVSQQPLALIEQLNQKFGLSLQVPATDLYDPTILGQQVSDSQRPAIIRHYYPEAIELYQELNVTADRPNTSEVSFSDEPMRSSGWIFRDWLDLRHTENHLKHETRELQHHLQATQLGAQEMEQHLRGILDQTVAEVHQLHQAKAEVEQELHHLKREYTLAQSQLNHLTETLQAMQVQLDESQTLQVEFQRVYDRWQEAERLLTEVRERRKQLRSRLDEVDQDLQVVAAERDQYKGRLAAVESSKFWQLRTSWLKVRQLLGSKEAITWTPEVVRPQPAAPPAPPPQAEKLLAPLPPPPVSPETAYDQWMKQNTPTAADLEKMAAFAAVLAYQPLISLVVPVYNPPEAFLREAIESVLAQIYPHWELCLADDCSTDPSIRQVLEEYAAQDARIKVMFRAENGHIARCSNSALELATGEFIALLDHDDRLPPEALYEVAFLLNRHPEADMIYSDEDKIDETGNRKDPFFKSDWCPDSFLSRMYTCHLGVYRHDIVRAIGGFRADYEGSQDYDLVLRFTEQTEGHKIFHIPKILYHWRIHTQSVASSMEAKPYAIAAAERALSEALERRGEPGTVALIPNTPGFYTVRYQIRDPKLVSIIIPTRDLGRFVNQCLESIFTQSTYPNYEVILIDNGSTEEYTEKVINDWLNKEPDRFRCYSLAIPFNYSKLNNFAVEKANGEYLLFLNNDTEIITPDWIEGLVEQVQRPSIGAAGALLLYPDNTVQHAGVVIGIGGVAGHVNREFAADAHGYFGQLITTNNYTAVTGACLMCRREVFEQVGGFNEVDLTVAFNDIDLCLKMATQGYRNILVPHVRLYHYESKSRGVDTVPEKWMRFMRECDYMKKHWQAYIDHDPCYNPNLSLQRHDYVIREPEKPEEQEILALTKQLQQTQAKLKKIQQEMTAVKMERQSAIDRVTAMESSKFWKLREKWMRVKQMTGLSGED